MNKLRQEKTQPAKAAGDLGKAGEQGLAKLLEEKARRTVEEVHGIAANRPTDQRMLELKSSLASILGDSGAQALREVETDIVPLRCRGDPHEMGRITNLLDAVSECRDYVSDELTRRGVPHIENPRTWNGY